MRHDRVTALHLCVGCDAIRDTERAFCHSCGEATNSYLYTPTAREAFAYEMSVADKVFSLTPPIGFEREPHTGLIHLGEAA